MIALILAMLARKRDSIEPALNKAGMQAPNAFARRAEDNGNVRFMETQKVDDAVFNIVRRHCYGLISDVAMPALRARGDDLQRIAPISAGQRGNRLWHGGRGTERAAATRTRVQYFFQLRQKTHAKHVLELVAQHPSLFTRSTFTAFQIYEH